MASSVLEKETILSDHYLKPSYGGERVKAQLPMCNSLVSVSNGYKMASLKPTSNLP